MCIFPSKRINVILALDLRTQVQLLQVWTSAFVAGKMQCEANTLHSSNYIESSYVRVLALLFCSQS